MDNIPAGMELPFTLGNFKDAAGNPARIDKVLEYVVDPAIATVVIDGDPATSVSGALRRVTVDDVDTIQNGVVRVDGKLGPDVAPFEIPFQFLCTAEPATQGGMTFGAPRPIPAP